MGKIVSVITDDLEHCYLCKSPHIQIHHCIHGNANRKLADKYHLVVALCPVHHQQLHDSNPQMDRYFEKIAQAHFNIAYPELDFREIFGRNYL